MRCQGYFFKITLGTRLLKDMVFCHLLEYIKTIIGYRTRFFKNCFQKVIHKAGEFLGNKIGDTITNSNGDKIVKPDENLRNVEEIIIPLEKRDEILNKLRKVL